MKAVLEDLWRRFWLRGAQFSGRYDRLEALYRIEDPWELDSESEQARFAESNRLIAQRFGKIETLLEIGCGEGAQSEYLAKICNKLTGIDVSSRAISRARKRLVNAEFVSGEAEQLDMLLPGQRYDLVTACEVLYYASDPRAMLNSLQSVTDQIFVTVYAPRFAPLAEVLNGPEWEELETIEVGQERWFCRAWARN